MKKENYDTPKLGNYKDSDNHFTILSPDTDDDTETIYNEFV